MENNSKENDKISDELCPVCQGNKIIAAKCCDYETAKICEKIIDNNVVCEYCEDRLSTKCTNCNGNGFSIR